MFDKEAIQELSKAQAITAACAQVAALKTNGAAVALPNEFQVHDLEKLLPNRRRARGTMETASIDDFAAYVAQHQEPGTTVFVSHKAMVANAVLNLGSPADPGHADNRAQFVPRATAAYTALLQVAGGQGLEQRRVAEFMEDWAHLINCYHENDEITTPQAIAAVRNITIESARNVEASAAQLSASKSSFESVKASSKHTLPTHIYFKCAPYQDFFERAFVMRLGIITSDKPAVTLRIVNREQHDEDMAAELKNKVRAATTGPVVVLVGDYSAKS